MNLRKRNQFIVTAFLFFVVGFTCIMTFYAGPRMMKLRDTVEDQALLYKCQKIHDGNTMDVQLRSSKRPNPNPEVLVGLAGLSSPPPFSSEDPQLIAWAEDHGIDPELAAMIGTSAQQTLLAFIRKQNMRIERADGTPTTEVLEPGTAVHAIVSGSRVGLKQIENGLAVHIPDDPQLHHELYANAERQAKEKKIGLWAE